MVSIMVLVVMSGVGIIFGFVLAAANKKFAMEVNPLIHMVEEALPKGQCGACGYAGCLAYAEAVVENPEVPPNLCIPGKEPVTKMVGELTGKQAEGKDSRIAWVKCAGHSGVAVKSYHYDGVMDCSAANLLQGGPKACKNGCIGFGSCVKVCPFDAIHMGENGLPVVDGKRCTGCGNCVKECPKHVIELMPESIKSIVVCNSHLRGAEVRKQCSSACIGCSLCVKSCPHGAIHMENNLAVVDPGICNQKCSEAVCTQKCPTGAIK